MRHAGNRHLPLLHHFKQRALQLGRRAVDLVGQQQVGEHRTQRGAELAGFLVVNARSHQVGRHQVGRELDALEVAVKGVGQCLDRQRLGQPRHAFDQQMPLRQQGHHDALQKAVLPDHHALDLVEDLLHQHGRVVMQGRGVGTVQIHVGLSEGRHAGRSSGAFNRHGKTDADKAFLLVGVVDGGDDADDLAVHGN